MVDYNRVPASLIRTMKFPVIHRMSNNHRYPVADSPQDKSVVRELSRRLGEQFTLNPDKTPNNPDGKIPGWNGEYLSATPSWLPGWITLQNVVSESHHLRINSSVIHVSDDLASSHFHMAKYGNHGRNNVTSIGSVFAPVIKDGEHYHLVLFRRPESAYLYKGKLEVPGTAVVPAFIDEGNYLEAAVSKIGAKAGLPLTLERTRVIGVATDNYAHFVSVTGYTLVDSGDVPSEFPPEGYITVPVSQFRKLVSSNPIEGWNFPTFLVACEAVAMSGKPFVADQLRQEQFSRLQERPMQLRSAVSHLGLEDLAKDLI